MNRIRRLIHYPNVLAALGLIALLSIFTINTQAGGGGFKVRPLTGASAEEVGQVAVQYTQDKYPSKAGTPQVVLARLVQAADLPALGLGSIDFASIEEPPLALVIVKGDFDVSRMPGLIRASAKMTRQAHYIGYVFDLWAGTPALTITSPQGSSFRNVLNDPSIPVDPLDAPLPTSPQPLQTAPKTLHYGETAPPAVQPSSTDK